MRKAHSMHGKPRMDKVIQQRKMSAPVESVTNGDSINKTDHVEEVDHPVMAGNHSSGNSSKSPSVERDISGDQLVSSDHQQVIENGGHDKVAEKITRMTPPPPPSTSPPILQGSIQPCMYIS